MPELATCEWDSAFLLIFSPNVAPFIYYTHLLPLLSSLLIGLVVFINNPKSLVNRVLLFITSMFSLWVYFDLILWASPSPEHVMFFWSAIVPIELLIYAGCLYLVYLFYNNQKDISLLRKLSIAVFFVPIILFAHTGYNVLGLSPDCDQGAIEGPLIQYMYIVELVFIIWAVFILLRGRSKIVGKDARLVALTIGVGTIVFLSTFTLGNIGLVFSVNPDYEQYKLFGMPIFIAFIAYSIVKFRAFNAKLITAQVLTATLAILILATLFLRTLENIRIVIGFTFVLVCIVGYNLVKNVRREIEQREKIEKLAGELEQSNRRQEGLIHFISHEIKGYLTKNAAVFAGVIDGDYGDVGADMKTISNAALSDTRKGVTTVMDILNASNLKKGTVKFDMKPFDLRQTVLDAVKNESQAAADKGVTLNVNAGEAPIMIKGDANEIGGHVIRNLVDNAVKYTPKGSIDVTLKVQNGKALLAIKDSGIGITDEDKKSLFTEGGRGRDSIKTNVSSTGYGLFIAKQVVDAHGGRVWAESEGPGKGSTFYIELSA